MVTDIGAVILNSISPTQITGDQNDYNPTGLAGVQTVMLDCDSSFRTITGLATGSAGRTVRINNISANTILLANQNTNSTASNRFDFGGYDVPLFPGIQLTLFYDSVNSRWKRDGPQNPIIPSTRLGNFQSWHMYTANPPHFNSAAASGGSISNFNGAGVAKHPGVLRYTLGTSTSGTGNMWVNTTRSVLFGNSVYHRIDWVLKILQLSNATDNYTLRVGYINSGTAEGSDAAEFRYNHGVNSGKWERVTINNTAVTATDTTIAAQTSTWSRFTVIVNPAGTNAEFFIDGVSVGSNTTNIPANNRPLTQGMMFVKTAGTTDTAFLDIGSSETIAYFNTTN